MKPTLALGSGRLRSWQCIRPGGGRPDRESERPAPPDRGRVAAGTRLRARLALSVLTPYCLRAGGMRQAMPPDLDATVAGHLFKLVPSPPRLGWAI